MTMNSPLSKALDRAAKAPYTPAPTQPDPATQPNSDGSLPIPDDGETLVPDLLDDDAVKRLNASPEGKAMTAWVSEQYNKSKNARREYERQWYLNLAFYSGKQYVEWSGSEDKMVSQPVTSIHTPRLTINKVQPIIRTEQAKLVGQKPSVTVMPSSNDDADMFAASAGEQVWESLYNRLNFPGKLSRATFWLSICGVSFLKTYWDAGSYDNVSETDGDICWQPLSPFNILVPDLLEPDLDCQSWVMDIQTRPTAWVQAAYGTFFPKGITPTVTGQNEILSAAGIGLKGDGNIPDSTVIKEVWVHPGVVKVLPEGGMLTVIDDTIVQAATNGIPYSHKEFPFAKLEHIPTGKFYAISTIEPLIPLQREYNRTQSQIVEAKNRSSKPQHFYREGSLDPTKITTEPGLYIPVKGSAEYPQPVDLPELPAYVIQFNQRMDQNFEDISGQHASTRGEAPAGMAATAISYLQEQDDAYLATTFQSIEQAIQKTAKQSLVLAATYWTLPRLIKATGEDGGFDAVMLRGSQIANATDVRIEGGTALPTSKSAKQATITDWMNRGFLPPEDGFELLDMPALQGWINKRKVDKKAAQIENIAFRGLSPDALEQSALQWQQQMQQNAEAAQLGLPPQQPPLSETDVDTADPNTGEGGQQLAPPLAIPVNSWDDHAVHITIHNLWRKSPSYALVPGAIRAEVQKHVDMHTAALQQQQQLAQLSQQGMIPQQIPGGNGQMAPQAHVAQPDSVVDSEFQQASMGQQDSAQYQADQSQAQL